MSDEIMQKLDTLAKGISDYQSEHKEMKETIDALDQDKLEKMAVDITSTLEEVNILKAKQVAAEKALARPRNKEGEEVCSELKTASLQYLRRGGVADEKYVNAVCEQVARKSLLGATEHQIEMAKKDLVVGSSPDGGYYVRQEVANFVIDRVFESSPMRQIANQATISSESLAIPIDDQEASAGWVGEVDSRPKTDTPKIGELTIHAHELYANPAASQKMVDDAGFDIEAWLQRKVADKFSRLENTSFVTGDGNKKPRGFLTYSDWTAAGTYERGKIEQFDTGVSGSFSADNFITVQNGLIEDYQNGATWVMKRATFAGVLKLKDGVGGYLINPLLLAQNAQMVLLGKPVIFFNDMPVVAADALAVAYGNFNDGYTVVDRIGIRVLRDVYTNKPYIQYYTTKRVGGDVTNYESIKIMKLAA